MWYFRSRPFLLIRWRFGMLFLCIFRRCLFCVAFSSSSSPAKSYPRATSRISCLFLVKKRVSNRFAFWVHECKFLFFGWFRRNRRFKQGPFQQVRGTAPESCRFCSNKILLTVVYALFTNIFSLWPPLALAFDGPAHKVAARCLHLMSVTYDTFVIASQGIQIP